MGALTRKQVYTYSSKVAGVTDRIVNTINPDGTFTRADGGLIPTHIGFMLVNPINLLTVEGLVTHFRASSLTAGATVVGIGVCYDQTKTFYPPDKEIAVNIPQVGGVIDFTKSLTSLIKPTGDNIIMVRFDRGTTLTLEMWKSDMLYTVQGVK